uniref:F-box domain protein n=1 Tax=Pithovirus LCPAC304 TaxID=2506594 RepID=A0A481ZBK3_9VIRU|nr:MAG: F-box domain protein [Pithovirus LCPAC304]
MEQEPLLELPFEDIVHIVEAMDVQSILLLCATSRAYRELCSNPFIAQIIDRKQRESKVVASFDYHPTGEFITELRLYFPESRFLQEISFEFNLTLEVAQSASQQLLNLGEDEDLGNDLHLAEDMRGFRIEGFSNSKDVFVTLYIEGEDFEIPGVMTCTFKTNPFARFLAEYAFIGIRDNPARTILRENGFVESYEEELSPELEAFIASQREYMT